MIPISTPAGATVWYAASHREEVLCGKTFGRSDERDGGLVVLDVPDHADSTRVTAHVADRADCFLSEREALVRMIAVLHAKSHAMESAFERVRGALGTAAKRLMDLDSGAPERTA